MRKVVAQYPSEIIKKARTDSTAAFVNQLRCQCLKKKNTVKPLI